MKIKLFCKDKVLEFLWRSHKGYENYVVPRGAYWFKEIELVIESTGEVSIWKPIKGGQDRAEKDLNPTHFELVEEQECPECEGTHLIKLANLDGEGGESDLCNCAYDKEGEKPVEQWGKVEKIVGKYTFTPS